MKQAPVRNSEIPSTCLPKACFPWKMRSNQGKFWIPHIDFVLRIYASCLVCPSGWLRNAAKRKFSPLQHRQCCLFLAGRKVLPLPRLTDLAAHQPTAVLQHLALVTGSDKMRHIPYKFRNVQGECSCVMTVCHCVRVFARVFRCVVCSYISPQYCCSWQWPAFPEFWRYH